MLNLRCRKGQVSSVDAIVASMIFAILLIFLIAFWFVSIDSIGNVTAKNTLQTPAIAISDLLLKSPGVPENWENDTSSLKVIGLAVSDTDHNVLDMEKLDNFTALEYNMSRELFGLDESREFYFMVEDINHNMLYEAGNPNITESRRAVSISRFALLEENLQRVRMRLIVYE